MTTRSLLRRALTRILPMVIPACVTACGADFDSPDKVNTLRVFAVQKDPPYASPTTDPSNPSVVNLTMLWHPGPHDANDVQRLWFSGCDDLPGDQYFTCLLYMHYMWKFYTWNDPHRAAPADGETWSPVDEPTLLNDYVKYITDHFKPLVDEATSKGVDPNVLITAFLSTWHIGAGSNFQYAVTPGIIEGHRPSTDPSVPNYGLSFIFFTTCAGHIQAAPAWENVDLTQLRDAVLGFPFDCYDDAGTQLGPDDFISGYTEEFVYGDGSTNNNPVIDGVTFDKDESQVKVSPNDYCIDGACNPPTYPSVGDCQADATLIADGHNKFPHRKVCSGKCPTYDFSPTLNPDNNNDDARFGPPKQPGTPKNEQMWIDYYADKGSLKHTVRLLRDAVDGWAPNGYENVGNTWTPPSEAGPVNLWAVVHDIRGGASWIRFSVCMDE